MKTLARKLLYFLVLRKLAKKIKFGSNCFFNRKSKVKLLYGSSREDVVLGNRVIMLGELVSSHKGRIEMHDYSKIGKGSKILCVNKVIIGEYSAIGDNTILCDNNNHSVNPHDRLIMRKTLPGNEKRSWKYSDNAPIIVGKNCWIGSNARICKGVNIGDGSVVAANTVVTKDVPANCIVAGNPGKIVKEGIDALPRYF